ncbi:MAG: energy-coupling factor transporter transmembrane component T, partial [Oscillospiraceae bacterium]
MLTAFNAKNPAVCAVYYLGASMLVMSMTHPIYLACALFISIAFNLMQDGGREMRRYKWLYIITALAMIIINPLTSHRGASVLFYLFDNAITLESIAYGAISAASVVTVLLIFTSFSRVLAPDKLMYLIGRALPNTAMTIMLSVRLVPHFGERLREISEVQKTQPVPASNKWQRGMAVLHVLLARSLEDAVCTAQSMRARGYRSEQKRTFYNKYNMMISDIIILFVM